MRILLSILVCAAALMAGEQTGRRAPGFSLPDADLRMHDLADYRGKIVLLEFMQTDCDHCAAFAPILNQVQQKYGDKVAIIAVANVPHDNPEKIKKYKAGHKVTYPVLMDQGQMEYSYVLRGTVDNPTLFLIDSNGMIRNDWVYGAFTRDVFEGKTLFNEIDRLLGAPAAAPKKK